MPEACSRLAALISPMIDATWRARSRMATSALPDSSTSALLFFTCARLPSISSLISFAERALFCASVRTSEATTAKPRPWSPARAASTAALRASRLVWKAMLSMVPMISDMRAAELLSSLIAETAWPRMPLPRSASSRASVARVAAWRAFSAVCFTVPVISSIEAAVSSSEDACASVRCDRFELPEAISFAASDMCETPSRTDATTPSILSVKVLKAVDSSPSSFFSV